MKTAKILKKLTRPVLLVGKAENCPELEYISGFRAVDSVVLLISKKGCYLVVPELEYGRAQRANGKLNIVTPESLGIPKKKRRHISEWALALLKQTKTKSITVPRNFPLSVAKHLEKKQIKIALAKKQIFEERQIKEAEECEKIKESQQAAVIAMRSAFALIASARVENTGVLSIRDKHLTSGMIRRNIMQILLTHDCIGTDVIVSHGVQTADPHEPGKGRLRHGEPILMDIFPRHIQHGYWGDLTRTVVKGKPSEEIRKMYLAVKAAQNAALAVVKPGVKCSTVHMAAAQTFIKRGFKNTITDGKPEGFIHSIGHGVGLEIHEAPSVGINDQRLRSGHVITIEPGLYFPGTGGVRIEDTIQVTKDGWRYLVPCEKKLEL